MYILKVYSVTIHWDRTQILKKSPSNKINGTKKSFFFLLRTPTNQSFTFHGFLLKLCAGFPIFDYVPFLLKFLFLFNKMHELWL